MNQKLQPISASPLSSEVEKDAWALLRHEAVISCWRRDASCDGVIDGGSLCWVDAGAVRKCLIRASGQRRIVDLLMPGDFFGFAPDEGERFSLQATGLGTRIARCPRILIDALCAGHRSVEELVRERAGAAIERLESHVIAQGRTTAMEKVGAYLLGMRGRVRAAGDTIDLPISRYDIADHLGLAVETVSRSMTELREAGLIEMDGPRRVRIMDPYTLVEGRD
jgi:CRP-like cAMP-binding protein